MQEFPEFKSYQKELVAWVQKTAKSKDLILAGDVIQFLIERLGVNLRVIENELEKLKLALYPTKMVKKEDIQNICTSSEDIFLLTDYILKGQKDLALLEFKKLSTNKHYLEILAVLQTNFSKLASIKVDSVSLNSFEIASKTKLPEFVVKKQLEKLKNVPMDKIIKIRENLLQAEYRVKTGEIAFYELPVELALLS
jgi:DNA polymerase-3 subunit delta